MGKVQFSVSENDVERSESGSLNPVQEIFTYLLIFCIKVKEKIKIASQIKRLYSKSILNVLQ